MLCSIVGCERSATKRGYCDTHYRRWQRGKPVNGPIKEPFSLEDLALREVAKANGLTTYISPRSCEKGHTERYAADGKCTECVKARVFQFRKDNPELVAAWQAANYAAHRDDRIDYMRERNAIPEIKEQKRLYNEQYYIEHREEMLIYEATQRILRPDIYSNRDKNKRARRRGAEGKAYSR